jgi:NADH dehydrogenase
MASPAASVLESRLEVERDRLGRIIVANDLTIPQHPDIYVVGDLASATSGAGEPLPATAPVAMQEGRYVARSIRERLQGRTPRPFHYRDRGNLAVIGRNAAVAEIRKAHFSGFLAWALWVTVHIFYLIGFENRLLVMVRWIWDYLARRGGARLILGDRD